MKIAFNFKKLSKDILAKREKDNLTFRAIAKETKMNPMLIHSMEAGTSVPSCANLAKVCSWLNKGPELYFETVKKQ